jgi:exosortase/archaeosortase family protein
VWRWYAARLGDSGDDALGPAALIALFGLSMGRRDGTYAGPRRWETLPATAALVVYAASFPFLPPLASALLAFVALGFSWSLWRYGTPFRPWALGLALLGLPMAASLQFYLGYPMRVASGSIALVLLRLSGIPAVREGVYLRWGGDLVMIDAPCSGIRMLWAGLLLGCCLAALYRMRARASLLAVGAAAVLALLGNAARTAALFWADTGSLAGLALPPAAHEAIGVIAFATAAIALIAIARRLAREGGAACAAPSRFS